MITDGVKTANQIQFQDENGNPTVPVVNENGAMLVDFASDGKSNVNTLVAGVLNVGTEPQAVPVNKPVIEISIANYSASADVTVEVAGKSYVIGGNLAVDLAINKEVDNINISSTAEGTKVQYVVKGVE